MNVIYRLATLNDLDQIIELRVLMQTELNGPAKDIAEYRDSLTKFFQENFPTQKYVSPVAEVNGILVSAAGMVVYHKPPSITGGTGALGYVSNVYTRKDYRGKGIAGELMKMLVEHGRKLDLDKISLGATESGKGVYERVGFSAPRFLHLEYKFRL